MAILYNIDNQTFYFFNIIYQQKQLKKRSTKYKSDWWYDIEASSKNEDKLCEFRKVSQPILWQS